MKTLHTKVTQLLKTNYTWDQKYDKVFDELIPEYKSKGFVIDYEECCSDYESELKNFIEFLEKLI